MICVFYMIIYLYNNWGRFFPGLRGRFRPLPQHLSLLLATDPASGTSFWSLLRDRPLPPPQQLPIDTAFARPRKQSGRGCCSAAARQCNCCCCCWRYAIDATWVRPRNQSDRGCCWSGYWTMRHDHVTWSCCWIRLLDQLLNWSTT